MTLLSKLDRAKAGEQTYRTIVVPYGENEVLSVEAVEDEVKYAGRAAGPVHPKDEPRK